MKKKAKKAVRKSSSAVSSKSAKPTAAKNTTGVTPLGDRVLVKPLSPEELTKATSFGLIIPDTADKEKSEQGVVMAVGPGKRDDSGRLTPVGVAIGDRVMFNKYGYDEVKVNGVEYYIVGENNILAVLNK